MAALMKSSTKNVLESPCYISNGNHSNEYIASSTCSYSDTKPETSQFRTYLNSAWDLENEDPIEYFRRVLTEIICDTSSKSYELGVPKYFSSDFIQKVDGKVLTYDDFISHQKAQKTQIVEDSVQISWQELHAHFYLSCLEQNQDPQQEKKEILNITSHHSVKMKLKESQLEIMGSCVSLIKINAKNGKIFQCNEFTHFVEERNVNSSDMKILNESWDEYQNSN